MEAQKRAAPEEDANRVLVTTTPALEGYRVARYIEVIAAQTVLGTGFLSEAAAWAADLFGAESGAIARKIAEARESALRKLRARALEVGANAVISTSFAYSSNSRSMVSVVVTGTAVSAVPLPDRQTPDRDDPGLGGPNNGR